MVPLCILIAFICEWRLGMAFGHRLVGSRTYHEPAFGTVSTLIRYNYVALERRLRSGVGCQKQV